MLTRRICRIKISQIEFRVFQGELIAAERRPALRKIPKIEQILSGYDQVGHQIQRDELFRKEGVRIG